MRLARLLGLSLTLITSACIDTPETDIPANIASTEEEYEVESVLYEIQNLLRLNGSAKNLKSIPVVITDTLLGDGKCILSSEGDAILINKLLFMMDDLDPNLKQISRLWSVLLHEIGHCYFFRSHEEKRITAYEGYVFQFKNRLRINEEYHCYNSNLKTLPGTVMGKNGISVAPEELKDLYVKELINKSQVPTVEELLGTSVIRLNPEINVQDTSEPTDCY